MACSIFNRGALLVETPGYQLKATTITMIEIEICRMRAGQSVTVYIVCGNTATADHYLLPSRGSSPIYLSDQPYPPYLLVPA